MSLLRIARGTVGVALVLTTLVVGADRVTAVTTPGSCVISGTGETTPGLFLTMAYHEYYTLSASATPCQGLDVVPGSFSGQMECPSDTQAACVPIGTASFVSPLGACSSGTMTHQGYHYTLSCGPLSAAFEITPMPTASALNCLCEFAFTGSLDRSTSP